jgi:hypothetical protein
MATVYTPRDAVKTPKPRRAVGVSHVAVDVSARTFKLDMAAPEVQRPEQQDDGEHHREGPDPMMAYRAACGGGRGHSGS